jgi:predicted nucleic acid-binding protein
MTPVIPGAVFDRVVLLQAAVSKKGPAFACLRLARAGQVRMVLSSDVLAEITDVLSRPELRRKFKSLTPEVAEAFLRDLTDNADFVSEVPEVFTYPRDPDDEPQTRWIGMGFAARFGDATRLDDSDAPRSIGFLMEP